MIKTRIGLCVCLLALTFSAMAQNRLASVEITGVLKMKKNTAVKLFKVVEGKNVEISNTMPEENGGRFGLLFYPEYEGLYVIGTGYAMTYNYNYKFYFKGGEKLSLALLDTTYVLNGKLNSKENMVLTQWHDQIASLEDKSVNFGKRNSTFVDFFPLLEEQNKKSKTFLNGKATGNKKFDRSMKDYMAWDLAGYAANFMITPRAVHPTPEEYSPFYATLNPQDFAKNTAAVYSNPYGAKILSALISLKTRQQQVKTKSGLERVKAALFFLPNDTLKGDYILDIATSIKKYDDYKVLMGENGKYILTASQKNKDKEILSPLMTLKTGDAAFNFSYPDKEGKTVAMADLKGKVVLVDVWATWCPPCRAEIPHLKKLEEEMKGKDVAFVSISVDDHKDKEKWLQMIKDENLGGIQLFASAANDLSKYYKITGIPRFMVFDKEGKIVALDSPRPSAPQLKALLEKTLLPDL